MQEKMFLLIGKTGEGKTYSLRNLPLEKTAYINGDGKAPSFKGTAKLYKNWVITNVKNVLKGLDILIQDENVEYIVIDTLNFIMNLFEIQVVNTHVNSKGQLDTMKGWALYQTFYKELIHKLKTSKKNVIVLTHPTEFFHEEMGRFQMSATMKGSLKNMVEADFTVVAYTYVSINQETDMPEYKFLVRKTKETTGWSVKSPPDMFEKEFTDTNDVLLVLDAIEKYNGE